MITGIILAAVIVGGTGLFIGVFLGVSGKKFAVEVDEREEAILGVLPGNNCGGCGYAGCSGLAAAIVAGAGTCEKAQDEYEYHGVRDCVMVNMMQDAGPKGCDYGCLGFGNCVKACPFDAIHIVNGIAVVDKEKCKACGKCVAACPKKLVELVPYKQQTFVQCNSNDKGKALMDVCAVGCIGCKLCEKNCEAGAITVTNFLAHIDASKCTNCGVCADKCPRKVIVPRKIPVS